MGIAQVFLSDLRPFGRGMQGMRQGKGIRSMGIDFADGYRLQEFQAAIYLRAVIQTCDRLGLMQLAVL